MVPSPRGTSCFVAKVAPRALREGADHVGIEPFGGTTTTIRLETSPDRATTARDRLPEHADDVKTLADGTTTTGNPRGNEEHRRQIEGEAKQTRIRNESEPVLTSAVRDSADAEGTPRLVRIHAARRVSVCSDYS